MITRPSSFGGNEVYVKTNIQEVFPLMGVKDEKPIFTWIHESWLRSTSLPYSVEVVEEKA